MLIKILLKDVDKDAVNDVVERWSNDRFLTSARAGVGDLRGSSPTPTVGVEKLCKFSRIPEFQDPKACHRESGRIARQGHLGDDFLFGLWRAFWMLLLALPGFEDADRDIVKNASKDVDKDMALSERTSEPGLDPKACHSIVDRPLGPLWRRPLDLWPWPCRASRLLITILIKMLLKDAGKDTAL